MRFHLPALPGQPITANTAGDSTCAFTAKITAFAKSMVPRGHEVIIYGDPEHVSPGNHVPCYPSCDPPPFTPQAWEPFNKAAAKEIRERYEPGDILWLIGGVAQQPLAAEFPDMFAVEGGIGYAGVFADFKVFESYAWMHTVYGQRRGSDTADGSFYDAVIPAAFDVDQFPRGNGGDYLLYVGRMTQRKGIEIAEETAKRLDLELKLCGKGEYEPTYGEHLGVVGPKERAELMGGAKALMVPTIYIEPFGCVAVEAQLCGTPAITTDWGAFTETVKNGISGFRCRTLGEFMAAVEAADSIDRWTTRMEARRDYSLEASGERYERYFERLLTLNGDGWYDTTRRLPGS